jgi:pyruvate/2-oxoglutarate/acetoin dehydrogenase E1 component
LVPLDIDSVVNSVRKTHRLVIVHEGSTSFGWGAEIAARVQEQAFDELDAPIARVGAKDVPIPYNMELEKATLPQVKDIVNEVRRSLYIYV